MLLDDCLTSYCEPHVNRAAVRALEAAGFEVHLAGLECCGRTLVSKGFLRERNVWPRANVAKLHAWAVARREHRRLRAQLPADAQGRLSRPLSHRADRNGLRGAQLIDDFLLDAGAVVRTSSADRPALLHGHCHQKALCGMKESTAFVTQLGYAPLVPDSGCCGMAGSFGYEHYDVSMKIGERVLFPAVRSNPESIVVAAGFSCRQQILHATGRRALHPVELMAANAGLLRAD